MRNKQYVLHMTNSDPSEKRTMNIAIPRNIELRWPRDSNKRHSSQASSRNSLHGPLCTASMRFFHCKPWIDYMRLQIAQTCILTGSCTLDLFIEFLGHKLMQLTLCSKCQIDGEDFIKFCGLLWKNELLSNQKRFYHNVCLFIITDWEHPNTYQ